MTRSDESPFFPEKGGIVDGEDHAHRRLVNGDGRQGFRIFRVGDRVADLKTLQAVKGANLTGFHHLRFLAREAFKNVQAADALLFQGAVLFDQGYLLPVADAAALHPSDGHPAQVVGVVQ